MKEDWILIRYGEISLKSDWVRKKFEHRLMDNIRAGFKEEGVDGKVKKGYGRIFVKTEEIEDASQVLSRVFGIVSFSPCMKLETKLEKIIERTGEVGEELIDSDETFAVRARRTGDHEFTSQDLEREIGSKIVNLTGAEVDLDNPDETVFVEVRQGQTYIFTEKLEGPGGMPIGTQGRVLSLFKGDCNSFLATWLLMKRGCSVTLLHGNLDPYRSEEGFKKAMGGLEKWSYGASLQTKKFELGEVLFKFQENVDRTSTCILCKGFLTGLASEIASEEEIKAIVSGESSGNSFEDFRFEDAKTELPVFRPLIGFSEDEIREKCKKIGIDFLLKKEKCKARTEGDSEVSEERLKEMESSLNFNKLLKEKVREVRKNENS